jgi:signal transduction histidine kinase
MRFALGEPNDRRAIRVVAREGGWMKAADLPEGEELAERAGIRHRERGSGSSAPLAKSPVPLAVLSGETFEIRYANPALRACPVLIDLLRSCASADGGTAEAVRLRHHLVAVVESGEAHAPFELPQETGRDSIVWRIIAWPVDSDSAFRPDVVLTADDVSDYVREREARASVVTEMREVNERLVLATLYQEELRERAQAASDAKSAFLATMSHELRTPLTAIIGYEELLRDGITGPVTPEQRTQLERIKDSATHLLALIDDVLTLARTEARHEVIQLVPVPLASVVESAISIVAPLASHKGLEFRSRLPDRAVTIQTDTLKLKQILVNLLGNAVKFCDQGSVSLLVADDEHGVTVEVSDTGIGIPPAYLEQVFDPFFQIHHSMTRRKGGSGLGLSVSRRLARLMGGDITVESEAGSGTTFRLSLPKQR